jgi:excinuclease ABC subunit C
VIVSFMPEVYDSSPTPATISPVSAAFEFQNRIEFLPANADEILRSIPAAPGVFALRGSAENSEPYLTRTADLRRRLRRLLAPPEAVDEQGRPVLSKRLNLREKVRWIEWTRTGSEFESALVIYCATRAAFGDAEARRRLRLHAPYFLRITMQHEHPRVYTTNKLSRRSIAESFGPFPSRAAAERYCDAVLDLFKLRRCYEDLQVHPDHPGCAYGEMKKCMEPCKGACTAQEYAAEARRVQAFFATRGESMLSEVAQQREAASEAMDFEQAAALHKQWERVKAASQLADELVRPVTDLRAVILQEAAPRTDPEHPDRTVRLEEAAIFLLERGRIVGPERLSTLGVRAVREQTAVGSSLFAQPLMLAPVPLDEPAGTLSSPTPDLSFQPHSAPFANSGTDLSSQQPESEPIANSPTDLSSRPESAPFADAVERPAAFPAAVTLTPEDRARTILAQLAELSDAQGDPEISETCDYLALFRRWYYRPEKQRTGEVFLPNPDQSWPIRRILNGAARVVLGPPAAAPPVDREAFKAIKTKVIHEGREGVERIVPVLPKRSRSRKPTPTSDASH